MTHPAPTTVGVALTDEDITLVQDALRAGRVRTLDGQPYDASAWDAEAVRDWLERTPLPKRARQILAQLRQGATVKSRPVAPTEDIALHALLARVDALQACVDALQSEVAELRRRVPDTQSAL